MTVHRAPSTGKGVHMPNCHMTFQNGFSGLWMFIFNFYHLTLCINPKLVVGIHNCEMEMKRHLATLHAMHSHWFVVYVHQTSLMLGWRKIFIEFGFAVDANLKSVAFNHKHANIVELFASHSFLAQRLKTATESILRFTFAYMRQRGFVVNHWKMVAAVTVYMRSPRTQN